MKVRLEDIVRRYGISASDGFLPENDPIERLPDPYYEPWEALVLNLPEHLHNDQARTRIDQLPALDTDRLVFPTEWRRAYTILAFLTHAYIWGGEIPSEVHFPAISCLDPC